jgi:hypothetical protein
MLRKITNTRIPPIWRRHDDFTFTSTLCEQHHNSFSHHRQYIMVTLLTMIQMVCNTAKPSVGRSHSVDVWLSVAVLPKCQPCVSFTSLGMRRRLFFTQKPRYVDFAEVLNSCRSVRRVRCCSWPPWVEFWPPVLTICRSSISSCHCRSNVNLCNICKSLSHKIKIPI